MLGDGEVQKTRAGGSQRFVSLVASPAEVLSSVDSRKANLKERNVELLSAWVL